MGVIALTPRVLLFTAALALFPFISTVTGSSLKVAGLEVWKYLWIVWLGMLAIHVVRADCFFDKWGGDLKQHIGCLSRPCLFLPQRSV